MAATSCKPRQVFSRTCVRVQAAAIVVGLAADLQDASDTDSMRVVNLICALHRCSISAKQHAVVAASAGVRCMKPLQSTPVAGKYKPHASTVFVGRVQTFFMWYLLPATTPATTRAQRHKGFNTSQHYMMCFLKSAHPLKKPWPNLRMTVASRKHGGTCAEQCSTRVPWGNLHRTVCVLQDMAKLVGQCTSREQCKKLRRTVRIQKASETCAGQRASGKTQSNLQGSAQHYHMRLQAS